MARCKATTSAGKRCRNLAKKRSRFCALHQNKIDLKRIGATTVGAVIGHVIFPGIGGIIAGGTAGNIVGRLALQLLNPSDLSLGPKTKSAAGVLKEVRIANELKKPIFQVIGYKDGSENWRVSNAGRVYRWNWENLKKLLR